MEFSQIFKEFLQKHHLTQAEFARTVGISTGLCNDWIKGRSEAKQSTLLKIAEAYQTTVDDFLQINVSKNSASLSADEHDLISNYKKLTPNSKQIIMTLVEMELHHIKATQNGETPIKILNTTKKSLAQNIEQSLENKTTEKAQFLKVFNQSAAAGFGDYLSDDSSFEMVSVPSIPFGTEFGIRISGDSMEPKIHDGDIAFVKREADMNQNEIGIFIYNGDAFCKQLIYSNGKYYLHSLNAKYKDIQLYGDSIYCVGKVIF